MCQPKIQATTTTMDLTRTVVVTVCTTADIRLLKTVETPVHTVGKMRARIFNIVNLLHSSDMEDLPITGLTRKADARVPVTSATGTITARFGKVLAPCL
jgi:hypothetical protein